MRENLFFAAGALLVVAAVSTFVYLTNERNSMSDLFNANVEALAQNEGGHIVCDSGICGQCFKEETVWPFYKCVWTGMQADFCDCDKTGWL